MDGLRKILVVDDGRRVPGDRLSSEIGELGWSSVTTAVEAAGAVLDLIDVPSAIVLRMPRDPGGDAYDLFLALEAELRGADRMSGVPVILWDQAAAPRPGGLSAILRDADGRNATASARRG